MRHYSLKLACAGLALSMGLAGCGGGSATGTQTSEVTCQQPWSWAKGSGQGSQSFSSQSIMQSAEVIWSMQNCNIAQLKSIQLTVCISHPETSELNLKLFRGTELTPLTLPKLDQTPQSGLCGQGALGIPWTYTITNPNFNMTNTSQQWRLMIEDEVMNQTTGFFDGWSFNLRGIN